MIEVSNLVKCYGGTQKAVDGLNFTIDKGQIVGFLGPNGAGKSTTMNIITGYISATEGIVKINGYDILKEPEKAKACIGYLPEQPPVYTDMTVLEYLKFVAGLKKVARKDKVATISYAMRVTKLGKMERRMIKNLSKGYRQRVGLAAALIGDPEVLILDEPTVGLDPMQIIEIRELIKNLALKHTVILSSHILQEISAVCDRVIIINKGKLVLDEHMDSLDTNIKNSECLSVTVKANKAKLDSVIKKNFDIEKIDYDESEDDGCIDVRIYTKERKDIREAFFNTMVDNKFIVLRMVVEKMSLEDIFLEATKEEDETDTRKKKKAKAKAISSIIKKNEEKPYDKKKKPNDNDKVSADEEDSKESKDELEEKDKMDSINTLSDESEEDKKDSENSEDVEDKKDSESSEDVKEDTDDVETEKTSEDSDEKESDKEATE